jgi:hypothetical protein
MAAKKRFNLELGPATYERVQALVELTEASSLSEVLRRALEVYDQLVRAQRDGAHILLRRPQGRESERLIIG